MGNFRKFSREGRGGFGRDRGSSRFGGERRDFQRREMHDVICAKCGKQCQVPFKPRNDKPVLCSECFEKQGNTSRNTSDNNRETKNTQNVQSGISKEQFAQLNNKLDKILTILENLEFEDVEDEDELELDDIDEDEGEDEEEEESKNKVYVEEEDVNAEDEDGIESDEEEKVI